MVRQNENHDHAGHQLHEDVLERVRHRHGNQQYRDYLNGKGQARSEEGHHDHGKHHHRHHQNERGMKLHDPIRWDDHHHHQEQHQIDLPQFMKHILIMKGFQVERHHRKHQKNQEELTDFHHSGIAPRKRSRSRLTLQ